MIVFHAEHTSSAFSINTSHMKKILLSLSLIASALVFDSCYKNPVTGRSSLNLVDEGTMHTMANQQYATFLSQNPAVSSAQSRDAEMVQRVGSRMATAVQTYLAEKGQSSLLSGYQWQFNLVNNAQANAWCMPGGKVVVYTGILPLTQNEAGLAVVMGHEIAHAVARHGNERMSQELAVQAGGSALSVALANQPGTTQNIFNTVFGVGSQLGTLSYSRKHESEADHMGLIFMALAGYNPNEAVPFWQRMASKGGAKPPQILSTHPADATRIANIQKLLPEAMKYYRPQAR
jgi:predicted Zn-dependent protease